MLLVRGLGRESEAPPNDQGTHDVEHGLDTISDQSVGVPQNSSDNLDGGEDAAGNDSPDRCASTACGRLREMFLCVCSGHRFGVHQFYPPVP